MVHGKHIRNLSLHAALRATLFTAIIVSSSSSQIGVRYVRVTSANNDYFDFGEIDIYSASSGNVARNKSASASSTYPTAEGNLWSCTVWPVGGFDTPSRGVDGDYCM